MSTKHLLSDLQYLVGPILVMVDNAREEDAPLCKCHRTHSGEESGKGQSLSNDEPSNDIRDNVLACDRDQEAPELGNDGPWDGIADAMLAQDVQAAQDAAFRAGFCSL